VLALYRAASTKIKRHVKIKGIANPYDLRYDEYFEQRRRFRNGRQHGAKGNAPTPPTAPATRTVQHWLEPAAACTANAPVGRGLSRMKGNFQVRF